MNRDGKEYFIEDMKQASLKQSRMGAYSLHIDFKNGESKEIYFASTISTKTAIISYFTGGEFTLFSTMQPDIQILIIDWAAKINELIDSKKI